VYNLGKNRIYYQCAQFQNKSITCKFYRPDATITELITFEPLETGIYYLDFDFTCYGDWLGKFYEGGTLKATRVFKVNVFASIIYEGQPLY